MATTEAKCGFYGTAVETYYVTPAGRVWIVQSEDGLGPDPVEIDSLPEGAESVEGMLTPDEAVEMCRRVEAVSGERLVESA